MGLHKAAHRQSQRAAPVNIHGLFFGFLVHSTHKVKYIWHGSGDIKLRICTHFRSSGINAHLRSALDATITLGCPSHVRNALRSGAIANSATSTSGRTGEATPTSQLPSSLKLQSASPSSAPVPRKVTLWLLECKTLVFEIQSSS